MLLNLLNNAFDAVQGHARPWIEVSARPIDGSVEILVKDSGKGIPELLAQKIMQPFFTTKIVGSGTGLGLSVARRIAVSHGGSLELDQRADHTTFVIHLPRSMGQQVRAA
jgi:C4-dicarboxylate-specific signal transduction histidine kinase